MRRTLAVLLTWAAPCWAADPTIVGPATTPEHRMVRLHLDGAYEAAVWSVYPFGVADGMAVDGGKGFVFVAPPGVFQVEATYVDWNARTFGKASGVFEVVGASPSPTPPNPGPAPDPGPKPPPPAPEPPTPIAGTLYVSYIVDASSVTPAQAGLRTSPVVRSTLSGLGARWLTYQSDEEDVDRLKLTPVAAIVGLPCAIVQGPDGRVLAAKKVSSGAEIVDMVARARKGEE